MSQVIPLQRDPANRSIALGAAIREFLAAGDFQRSTVEVYECTLEALLEDLGADVSWGEMRSGVGGFDARGRWSGRSPDWVCQLDLAPACSRDLAPPEVP